MARALYNRDTLARIRGLTGQGLGVNAIARELEWEPRQVRDVGQRHAIPLIEDVLGKPKIQAGPKPVARPALEPMRKEEPVKNLSLRPRNPKPAAKVKIASVPGNKIAANAIKAHPRAYAVSFTISFAARDALKKLAGQRGKTMGTIMALALDHAVRCGKAEQLFDGALAEIEAQP